MQYKISPQLLKKEAALKQLFREYGAVVIAYSGGVDSTYLADVGHEMLTDDAHLIIADSPSIPREELEEAIKLAELRGWHLDIIKTKEFDSPDFLKNNRKRCYYCKHELFKVMRQYAVEKHISVIIYGETADDGYDPTRVGVHAARESHAKAPLVEAKFSKDEIRECSHARGLPTWQKASFACLASRIPTGNPLSSELLLKVETAEKVLQTLGFRQYRVRHHDTLCRIEISVEDFPLLFQSGVRERIVVSLQDIGYRHVTLDLAGYRTGSTAG